MRILLTGAQGQLAGSLQEVLPADDLIALSRQTLDICDASKVTETLRHLRPDVVINTAALRRPDECEAEPERTFAVNAIGVRNMAVACAELGPVLVQVSTDNVFDGMKTSPYLEEDAPNPINAYGISKLAGEFFVRSYLDRFYIVRTGPLFGEVSESQEATNFVQRMLRRAREGGQTAVVTDQYASPTFTIDLAQKIRWLINMEAFGLYHITNTGECSWYDFARAIFAEVDSEAQLAPTTAAAVTNRARRPRYAVLGHGALQRLGSDDLPLWQDALERYLRALKNAGWA